MYETNSAQAIARVLGKITTPPVALMAHASNDHWMASVSFAWLLPMAPNFVTSKRVEPMMGRTWERYSPGGPYGGNADLAAGTAVAAALS